MQVVRTLVQEAHQSSSDQVTLVLCVLKKDWICQAMYDYMVGGEETLTPNWRYFGCNSG